MAMVCFLATFAHEPPWVRLDRVANKTLQPSSRAQRECESATFCRAAVMQGMLAVVGLVARVLAWAQGSGIDWLVGGLLLGAMVPFTLVIIMPTNRRLLDASLDRSSGEARELLERWGRLHAVRTVVGVVAFVLFVSNALRS